MPPTSLGPTTSWAATLSKAPEYIECGCGKYVSRLKSKPEKYRKHKNDHTDEVCDYSGTVVPEEKLCQSESRSSVESKSASSAPPPQDDAPESASPATSSTQPSPSSPDSGGDATTASAPPVLPGIENYAKVLGEIRETQAASYKALVEANLTPFSYPAEPDWEEPQLFSQPAPEPEASPEQAPSFSQPAGRRSEAPAQPMSDLGKEMTARLKEMFYAYDNRRSADNRSAQVHLGPSEMGTPCDRRLALSIMRMPPVNPGGDGWAAFVGTCIHAGLEQMFMWADAGTGRFSVETRLEFPSDIVPKGTADLIDRTLFMLDDHKCQGRWSRNKLKSTGPSPTYRVQAHVYAKGARLQGERIEYVAIISWPRDEATLDDLYVWTEPYRPDIADKAFERVDDIAAETSRRLAEVKEVYPDAEELEVKARVGSSFIIADDCRYCPFYLPNSRDPLRGCNGKR